MRERWQRSGEHIHLDRDQVSRLLRPVLSATEIESWRPTDGGLRNANFLVVLRGAPGRVLLRLNQGSPEQARTEAAINRRVDGRVPVARFLHSAETNPVTGGPYAVLEWIDGQRLERVIGGLDESGLASLGTSVGRTLAQIHAIRFDKPGFFDSRLAVPETLDLGGDGLVTYLKRCLLEGRGGERLGHDLTADLLRFAERHGHRLAAWLGRPCLAHCDFNGSNILVREDAPSRWGVAAVIDWEFAFSGSSMFDFANLLRPPLGRITPFVAAVERAYLEAGGQLPQDWRRISQIADLYNWADFLQRPKVGPTLIADARSLIRQTLQG